MMTGQKPLKSKESFKMNITKMPTKFGNASKDQVVVSNEFGERAFISYGTTIVISTPEGITLDENYWDYSVTTGNYRNQFLEEGIAETRAKIASGEYRLADLNK